MIVPNSLALKVIQMAGTKRARTSTPTRAAKPAKKPRKAARRAKKTVAAPRARADKPIVAAAPLLATAPKKVGKVTRKTSDAVKPDAPYQPMTDVAPLAPAAAKPTASMNARKSGAAAIPAFDPLALARPWMQLGFKMTLSNFALQARVVRAAMDLPPTAVAMRQGSAAYKAWLALMGPAQHTKG